LYRLCATVVPSRFDIGINLATLVSGIPEPQVAYFVHEKIGIMAAGGYTFRPLRSAIMVDDGIDLQRLHGAYWKLGVKGRLFPKYRKRTYWLQLMYTGSTYHEKGTSDLLSDTTGVLMSLQRKGTVHGITIAPGIDYALTKHIEFRFGLQLGFYKRNDHIGNEARTYQPGFGSIMFACPQQIMIGFNYRVYRQASKKVTE
jgi:hypothetical protein